MSRARLVGTLVCMCFVGMYLCLCSMSLLGTCVCMCLISSLCVSVFGRNGSCLCGEYVCLYLVGTYESMFSCMNMAVFCGWYI